VNEKSMKFLKLRDIKFAEVENDFCK